MAGTKVFAKGDALGEVVRSFAVNEEINQLLIERLDPRAWLVNPSPQVRGTLRLRSGQALGTRPGGRTRTIAAIFVHMHHVRRKWIRVSAPGLPLPSELDRDCTQAHARKALRARVALCVNVKMIEDLLGSSAEKQPKFLPDGWARLWPVGPMM